MAERPLPPLLRPPPEIPLGRLPLDRPGLIERLPLEELPPPIAERPLLDPDRPPQAEPPDERPLGADERPSDEPPDERLLGADERPSDEPPDERLLGAGERPSDERPDERPLLPPRLGGLVRPALGVGRNVSRRCGAEGVTLRCERPLSEPIARPRSIRGAPD
jgi:hypothetical protein